MPPTPTPFPTPMPGSNPIDLPDLSLWDFTDEAIQVWNSAPQITFLIQAFLLIGLVIGGVMLIVAIINSVSPKE